MADILLVHGSCHGAWCWRDLVPALDAMGHKARAIDLPSHGNDPTPVNKVTLDRYAQAILAACTPDTVVLGHSMGGYAITAAAEVYPQAMARLIYLCAYVPQAGLTLAKMRELGPSQPLLPALVMAPDKRSFTIDPTMTEHLFYHDCPAEAVEYASAHLCPQAVAPNNTALPSVDNAAALPRAYIRCMNDHTIPPALQVAMSDGWPEGTVFEMPTGHSPFFADPLGLAQIIDTILKG